MVSIPFDSSGVYIGGHWRPCASGETLPLFNPSDGSLLDLKLVASSGAQEFDARALGSVADGLKADATAFAVPRPEGTLSLWALLGERQTDSAALAAAQKVYRYALLDVVDLKPTVIDLERRGKTEQLRFTARLLATF